MSKTQERVIVFRAKDKKDCILCSSSACYQMGIDPKRIENSQGNLVPVRLICSDCMKSLGLPGTREKAVSWDDIRKKLWVNPDDGWDHP